MFSDLGVMKGVEKSRNQMLGGYVKWLSVSKNEMQGLLPEVLPVPAYTCWRPS